MAEKHSEQKESSSNFLRGLLWVPSLYLAEGFPYVLIMAVSVILYKDLGLTNTEIALYTSYFYLPWVIKPLWSPFVDMFKTRRIWILSMHFLLGAAFALIALTIPADSFVQYTLAFFYLAAFSSATHDIAIDGFYMHALDSAGQAFFVGIRSTFYRIAMILGQGALVMLAGALQSSSGNAVYAWSITFYVCAGLFFLFFVYHWFVLPKPESDVEKELKSFSEVMKEFLLTFVSFFKKKRIIPIILFLLFYRFAEAQLVKIASPFLLDSPAKGGLGLTTSEVGFAYGTVGIIALMAGGILGGLVVARHGLKRWFWIMVLALNIPDALYLYLAYVMPSDLVTISICVGLEQFGYGFGFTAYMLYMIYIADGEHKTAHFALATGIMALGMMLPSMMSGWLQEALGYRAFFIWVMIATIPVFVLSAFIKIEKNFGIKNS